MKVLFLSGGIDKLGNHEYRFLKSLFEAGHDVYLVSYHPEDIAEGIQSLKGLKIIQKKPRFFVKFQRYFYLTRYFHFKNVLKRVKPDIIHGGNVWNYSFLGALSGFHPLLVMPMGSDIMLFPRRYFIARWITKFTIRRAEFIIPDCEEVKEILLEEYNYPEERMFILPGGVELDLFNPTVDGTTLREQYGWKEKIVLIMTRHLEPVYGIEFFINALPHIMSANPDVRVFLIGGGSLGGKIANLIRKHGIEDRVKLMGRTPREEIVKYLNAADIYVSSSLSDGTSISLLEAMACQLPIVVSDVPGNLEWIEDGYNGFVVPRKDSKALAGKILELVNDMSLQQLMGRRNLAIARERADWRINFKNLLEIYRRLIERTN